jgi:hypothetical protein
MAERYTTITLDGDREFDFLCTILVAGRGIQLSTSTILYLEVRESIFNGFPEGMLIIDNNTGSADSVFSFTGDNINDLIIFYLKPKNEGTEENFAIQEVFSIYEVEDVPVGEFPQGAKKILFRNTLANEMRIKKNSLTVLDFHDEDISNLSDNERAVKTGNVLKKLFGKDIKKDYNIPRTADFQIDDQEWDAGKYSIFPNWCAGTETLFESIQKAFLKHISEEEPFDKCYLKYNRFDKKLSLISMSKLLMKNIQEPKKYFLENLVLGTFANGDNADNIANENAPRPKVSLADTLADISNIRSLKFFDLSSEIFEKDFVINIPTVVDFDNTTRFNLGEKNIKDIFEKYKKFYVTQPFKDRVDNKEPLPSTIWENTRKKITTQYNKVIVTPYKSWDHAYDVEVNANILTMFLLKGLNCTLSLRGSTHRTIGKFVDIELKDTFDTNKFSKLPGRWLVTECSHIITKDRYWNSLNCVKTYRNF